MTLLVQDETALGSALERWPDRPSAERSAIEDTYDLSPVNVATPGVNTFGHTWILG